VVFSHGYPYPSALDVIQNTGKYFPIPTPKAYNHPVDNTGTRKLMATRFKHTAFALIHHTTILLGTLLFPVVYTLEKTKLSVSTYCKSTLEYAKEKHSKTK